MSTRWLGGAGLVTTVGALVGVAIFEQLPVAVPIALLALAAAALLDRPTALAVALAIPGAALVGIAVSDTVPAAASWVVVAAAGTVAVAVVPARMLDAGMPRCTGVLLLVSAVGVYVTVPDTELARIVVGAAVVGALVGCAPDARAAPLGTTAAIGLLAWVAAAGGAGRPGAVVGGLACLGVLALGPVAVWSAARPVVVVAVQVALVAVVARIAGLEQSAGIALVIAFAAYGVAVVVLVVSGDRR
jgi:hypothetical protein